MSTTIAPGPLRTPQDFYDAVNLLHTAALDYLPDRDLAPVVEGLERAMNQLLMIEGVRA